MKRLISLLALIAVCTLTSMAQFHDAPITQSGLNVGVSVVTDSSKTEIEPIKYYKQKVGSGAFLSALTYGIAKVQNKNFYKGKNSPNQVRVGDTIRFSFGPVPPAFLATHYMFQDKYTIRNFSLCRFDVKKDHRELKTGEFSAWSGGDVGVKENTDIEFEVTVSNNGVYDAKIIKAEPGEYCFVFTDNGIGAYMNVFDFSVPKE